ncbi:unnamed protein product, partial [marine sediment metagenome]
STARVEVGADVNTFGAVYAALFHESFEAMLHQCGHRYRDTWDSGNDVASVQFMFDHAEFDKCCADASDFILACSADLQAAWRKWRKKKNKKE